MILSHNRVLYNELFIQIARMHDEVDYRRHLNTYQGQKGSRKYYPCVSVGAEYDDEMAIGHHRYYSNKRDFYPLVSRELMARLGNLNDTSINYPACQNKVGHCAENYAASEVLNDIDPQGSISDNQVLSQIGFTKAFQPRTWKNRDWCANCHTMFD